MALNGGGTDGLESPGKDRGKTLVDRKRGAILKQHLLESALGNVSHLLADAQGNRSLNQGLHKLGKRGFTQLVVKGFVGDLVSMCELQAIEMLVQAGNRTDLAAPESA
ncbi:hypothetical protein CDAIGKPJ_04010 [Aeromonas salmonicida]